MKAKYDGTCPKCQTSIEVGEDISKENGRWHHFGCTQNGLPKHEYDSNEYAAGRAEAQMRKAERKVYGDALAEVFHAQDELNRYNAGYDD
jgi:hypothetical protein